MAAVAVSGSVRGNFNIGWSSQNSGWKVEVVRGVGKIVMSEILVAARGEVLSPKCSLK
jgi:hypothetical protein